MAIHPHAAEFHQRIRKKCGDLRFDSTPRHIPRAGTSAYCNGFDPIIGARPNAQFETDGIAEGFMRTRIPRCRTSVSYSLKSRAPQMAAPVSHPFELHFPIFSRRKPPLPLAIAPQA